MGRGLDDWLLCQADLDALSDLRDEVWGWRRQCWHGGDLIAVGAAIAVIDALIYGEVPRACGIQLALEPERHNPDIAKLEAIGFTGTFRSVALSVSDAEIDLSIIRYVETGEGSFDHDSDTIAYLIREGGFDTGKIGRWLSEAESARSFDNSLFTTIDFLAGYD